MIRTLGSWAGLALLICFAAAALEVSVFGAVGFANLATEARAVGATALLYAVVALPAALVVGSVCLGRTRDRPARRATADAAVVVTAAGILPALHALRELHDQLPVPPLSPAGLAASAGLACAGILLGLAGVLLARRLGLADALTRGRIALASAGALLAALGVALTIETGSMPDDIDAASQPTQPNVLLISIDSVRADDFWEYLDRYASDSLRAFADGSRRYRRAYTTYTHSLPSHASMLTGLYPPEHGAITQTTEAGVVGTPLAPDAPHLAERFAEAGYETFGVMSNNWLGHPYGLETGFETYLGHGSALALGHFDWSIVESVSVAGFYKAWIESQLLGRLHWNSHVFLTWLSERDEKRPFFAFLHYIEMHVPHRPEQRFRARFDAGPFADLDGVALAARLDAGEIPEAQRADAIRRLHQLSLAQLAQMETAYVPVLERLEALGRLDDTIVVLTSDHGDNLYEKDDAYGHSHTYEPSGRVPLLVRGPGIEPGDREELVSVVDIAPTFYAFAGLQAPERQSGLDWLAGRPRGAGDWIYLQGTDARHSDWARAIVWQDGRKFIRDAGREQAFDLHVDPGEGLDLADSDLETAAELRDRFDEIVGAMQVADTAAPIPIEALGEDVRDGLRALGYIE